MAKPALLSWSGGKDSALALQAVRADADVEVVGLVTTLTRPYDRISVHGVRRSLLVEQAARAGLPLHEVWVDAACTNDDYERAYLGALARIAHERLDVKILAFGDLFLQDVRAYRERMLAGSGFTPMFPLWGRDTARLARQFVDDGFLARLVCVDTTQLDSGFAGRTFDAQLLAELPRSVDPCGERGEFHTFVAAGPVFTSPVHYRVGATVLRDDRFMYCDLE